MMVGERMAIALYLLALAPNLFAQALGMVTCIFFSFQLALGGVNIR